MTDEKKKARMQPDGELDRPQRGPADLPDRSEPSVHPLMSRYRALADNLPLVTYQALPENAGRTMLYLSPRLCELIDCAESDYRTNPDFWPSCIHAEDRERVLAESTAALAEDRSWVSEYRAVNRSGHALRFRDEATLIRDDSGRTIFIHGVLCDLTEQSRLRDILEDQLRFLKRLSDTMPNPVFYKNTRGVYLWCNQAFEEYLGLPHEEIIGHTVHDLLPGELANVFHEMDEDLLAHPGVKVYETVMPFADGSWRDVIFNKAAVHHPDGRPAGVIAVIQDITRRKQAERALGRANRALQTMSACSRALTNEIDEPALLEEICRIIIDQGGYDMAWVAYAGQDPSKRIRPVGQAGIDGQILSQLRLSWKNEDTEPVGRAIRTGQPVLNRNVQDDPLFVLISALPDRPRPSCVASLSLPLLRDSFVIGALNIYTSDTDAFDPEEIRLLTNLADGLSYGIMVGRIRTQRLLAEEAFRRTHHEMEISVRQTTAALDGVSEKLGLETDARKQAQESLDLFALSIADELKSAEADTPGPPGLKERMESFAALRRTAPRNEKIKLSEMLESMRLEFASRLARHDLDWSHPAGSAVIQGDPAAIAALVRALAEHALKHGLPGLTALSFDFHETDDGYEIALTARVSDLASAEKIAGKTGLEWAMVRDIAARQHGEVRTETGPDDTVRWVISLPRPPAQSF